MGLYKTDFHIKTAGKLIYELLELILLNLEKQKYFPQYWSGKGFKGPVMNWVLPSLHGGSLKITLKSSLWEVFAIDSFVLQSYQIWTKSKEKTNLYIYLYISM